ncbi:MAG: trimethylamine methyltransferase family protein [Chloroflexota bacterium]|jgi:trimethylamine---corrinoid protein Co-methyltransferase
MNQRVRRRERPKYLDHTPIPLEPGLQGGRYKPLDEVDIDRIHDAALAVLERTGVHIVESEARDLLESSGASVDQSSDRVFMPRRMVEKALELANRRVVLYSRDGRFDLDLRSRRVHLGTGGAAVLVLDLETGQARESVLRDLYDIGRLVDTLDNIHFYLRPVVARDVDSELIDVNTFYATMAATTKHVMGGCYFPGKVADLKQLAVLIAGSDEAFREQPFFSLNLGFMVSPLKFAPETTETLTLAVREGFPVVLVAAPLSGATAPASLAGTLVQVMAETLAGLTYVQILRPGHPLLMGNMPLVADLRSGNVAGGNAELAIMNAACAQICQRYGLPIYNTCGLTDSKFPDAQAGYETALTVAVTALAGAEYNHHAAGMLESMLAVSYEKYVIDDDINAMVMRLLKGIDLSDEALSLNVIHEVCNGEGHYLGHPQTLALMQSEYTYPLTADRRTRQDWESDGSPDMRESARRRAREVLKSHFPPGFSQDVDRRIRETFEIALPTEWMRGGGYP